MKLCLSTITLLVVSLLIGCSAFTTKTVTPKLALSTIEKIRPGDQTKSQVASLIGKPTERLPGESVEGEFWYYKENGLTRVSIYFPKDSDVVDTVSWEVYEGDLEQDLRTVLRRYAGSKWTVKTVDWINPHLIPNECFFRDEQRGLSVEYGKARKEVSSIQWWDPSRKPAASKHHNRPPKFCLAGHCEDGIPAKQWLKDSNWKLCEIP